MHYREAPIVVTPWGGSFSCPKIWWRFFSRHSSHPEGRGFFFLPKTSDDLFSRHTLDAHIRFKLNSSKPVSTTLLPQPPFSFSYQPTRFTSPNSALSYKNCFKNFFDSEGVRPNPANPLDLPLNFDEVHFDGCMVRSYRASIIANGRTPLHCAYADKIQDI